MSLVTITVNPLDTACHEWSELVGSEAVIRAPELLQYHGRTTLPQAPVPAAILRPTQASQLPAMLKIAGTYQRFRFIPLAVAKIGAGAHAPQIRLDEGGRQRGRDGQGGGTT